MKTLFTLLACLIFSWGAVSQDFPSERWHKGTAVLADTQQEIEGMIKYDLENNVIQVNVNNVLRSYSSRKLLYFRIYDDQIRTYRTFYSIPYFVSRDYKAPILFEVVYEGQLTLLTRESIEVEHVPASPYTYSPNVSRQVLVFTYYFLDLKGNIIEYNQKKNELVENIMVDKSESIAKYIKRNRLDTDERTDLARITAYYNELLKADIN